MKPNQAALAAENEQAFLRLIRFCEFGRVDDGDYHTLYGFAKFTDDSDHPRRQFQLGVNKEGRPVVTTAAGAYQITETTFDEARRKAVVSDFTPASQDKVALWLITVHHARDLVDSGQIGAAIAKLNKTWVSLPGGSGHKLGLADALVRFSLFAREMAR